jgi:DNA-directed RNA polymerase subunit RPC12/RpoP
MMPPQQQVVACPQCGWQNSVGQQFCGACGAKLTGMMPPQQQVVACPQCGSQNPVGQQFCGTCGAKLAGELLQQDLGRVMEQFVERSQIRVQPTWGLAWGLYWRMLVLGLFVSIIMSIIVVIMVLVFYPAALSSLWMVK